MYMKFRNKKKYQIVNRVRFYVFIFSTLMACVLFIGGKYDLIYMGSNSYGNPVLLVYVLRLLLLFSAVSALWFLVRRLSSIKIANVWQWIVFISLPFTFYPVLTPDETSCGWLLCWSNIEFFFFLVLLFYFPLTLFLILFHWTSKLKLKLYMKVFISLAIPLFILFLLDLFARYQS